MSHYLKLVLDAIFGRKVGGRSGGAFRNEIVWCYSRPSSPKQRQLSRVHDIIFWYTKGEEWVFNPDLIRQAYAASSRAREGYSGQSSKIASDSVELNTKGKFPENWIYIPPLKGNSREHVGFPTQKPLALLDRIIQVSSNEGASVFDPFCGCATTLVAADRLNRDWIGIDISPKASELVVERIRDDQGMFQDIIARDDFPQRTDLGNIPRYSENGIVSLHERCKET